MVSARYTPLEREFDTRAIIISYVRLHIEDAISGVKQQHQRMDAHKVIMHFVFGRSTAVYFEQDLVDADVLHQRWERINFASFTIHLQNRYTTSRSATGVHIGCV